MLGIVLGDRNYLRKSEASLKKDFFIGLVFNSEHIKKHVYTLDL